MNGGKNAQEIVMEITKNNNNPIISNLIKMAQEGNTQEIENIARNMCKEPGRDFDKEFSEFISKNGRNVKSSRRGCIIWKCKWKSSKRKQ